MVICRHADINKSNQTTCLWYDNCLFYQLCTKSVSYTHLELKNGDEIEQEIKLYTRDISKITLYTATFGNNDAGNGYISCLLYTSRCV